MSPRQGFQRAECTLGVRPGAEGKWCKWPTPLGRSGVECRGIHSAATESGPVGRGAHGALGTGSRPGPAPRSARGPVRPGSSAPARSAPAHRSSPAPSRWPTGHGGGPRTLPTAPLTPASWSVLSLAGCPLARSDSNPRGGAGAREAAEGPRGDGRARWLLPLPFPLPDEQ